MLKKLLPLLLCALSLGQSAEAAQPLRRYIPMRQSDGTTIEVCKSGNHRFAFYRTRDGYALMRGASGDLCHAAMTDNGIMATNIVAHEANQRTPAEKAALLSSTTAYNHLAKIHPAPTLVPDARAAASTTDGLGEYGKSGLGVVSSIGTPTIPVVMVAFPDRDFLTTNDTQKLTRLLNEKGYADEQYVKGSVKDYFSDQSQGLFVPSFDVVAKVTVSQNAAYYGANNANGSIDAKRYTLIEEALQLAANQGVDFSKYKVGTKVPLVSIYFAGPGEQSSYEEGCDDYLWAHFSTRSFTVGETQIGSYFIGNELLQDYQKPDGSYEFSDPPYNQQPIPQTAQIDGIGIFCHEFGHALGLPDFYYTGSNTSISDTLQTMTYWSVMDYGNYMYDGYAPVGYNAYERSMMGWLQVQDLTAAQKVELAAFDDIEEGVPTALRIVNDADANDYYLLENRQVATWYPSLMGHGLLITRVRYNSAAWNGNRPNNDPALQRFSYIPADGERSSVLRSLRGDVWPGTSGNINFAGEFNKPIYGIEEVGDRIQFAFIDGTLTGIATPLIPATTAAQEVFTTDGRHVCTLAPGEALNTLPAGLYIVRSADAVRKVIVK